MYVGRYTNKYQYLINEAAIECGAIEAISLHPSIPIAIPIKSNKPMNVDV